MTQSARRPDVQPVTQPALAADVCTRAYQLLRVTARSAASAVARALRLGRQPLPDGAAGPSAPGARGPHALEAGGSAWLGRMVSSGWAERLGWLVLGGVLLGTCSRAFAVPEAGWDAYSHWGLRALAYAQAGSITDAGSEHDYYPPLVPLLEAFLYRQRGLVSIDLGKDIWPLVGSAFAICLAWHARLLLARRWLAPYVALGVVLGTSQLLEDFSTGQADLALSAFLTLATLAALQALRAPRQANGWLLQAGVFAMAAGLTKYEGLPRVAVVVAAIGIEAALARRRAEPSAVPRMGGEAHGHGGQGAAPTLAAATAGRASLALGVATAGSASLTRPRRFGPATGSPGRAGPLLAAVSRTGVPLSVWARVGLGLALPAVAAYVLWQVFVSLHSVASNAEHLGGFQPQGIGPVLGSLLAVLAGVRTGGGVLVVLLALGVAGRGALRPPVRLLGLVALGQTLATLLAFLLSSTPPDVTVRTTATRLIEQFLPVALLAAGVWLAEATGPAAADAPELEPIIATTAR